MAAPVRRAYPRAGASVSEVELDEGRYRNSERRLWESIGATRSERRLHLQRNDVTVRVQEIGEGPPIVFIHGANTSGVSWAKLAAGLTGFRCLLLDRPGTGLSEPLRTRLDTRSLPAFADTLVIDILDALDLDAAHVVATSFGGYIALRSAAAHPDRVRRMVQFSWPAGATRSVPGFLRVMSVPVLGRLLAAAPASERSARMTFRRIGHAASLEAGRITREDIDCYVALLRDTDTMRNELAMGRALISPLRGIDRLFLSDSLLTTIAAPTLFVWGENDPFGGADTARALVERIPGARLELMPGAGHAPWLDDLAGAVRSTREFLSI